ncbi:pyridoxamine 5'-phosphate oxidase [Truncatella angustata]|uniref:pyridoxal 5'-phosphate synthase n=1 Tax=Truncatella angustata TaxID=152316 RepID=A0A9P8UP32_9PEZI|nr:pyridoxamine 5'-phosphate oxidase [Truncatella angustata]KAH6656245.1 pyridoxamine 5'-phosphate oxidase [Truncatella angustata]
MSHSEDTMRSKLRKLASLKGPFLEFDGDLLPSTPHAAFEIWLGEAIARGITEPHAMTLSTVDESGCPDARVLILKDLDERGWHFAAKDTSPKGQQITKNADVALTFYWSELGRQVRIRGRAGQLSDKECAGDFLSRPASSKISAMASKQSQVLTSPDELREGMAGSQAFLRNNPEYVMPGWKVFAVEPVAVEFWQGATDRQHRRIVYTREDKLTWEKRSLWP